MKRKRMTWKVIFCLGIFISALLLGNALHAQESTLKVSGRVVNAATNEPVVNATVTVKGTKSSTITDANGNFTINAAKGSTLVITSVGHVLKEIKVTGSSAIDVRLEEEYRKMDEVVVVGYGQMKKTDLSSSQVSVSAADIQKTVNTSLDQALQGRAANVYVTQSSSQPGAASSVIIRGFNSMTQSSQPLYVIDGVQFKPSEVSDDPYNHPSGFSNLLSNLNPEDIETINILEGPAATAIFGATGANGVVMITTKKGKEGQTKVSLSTLFTLQDKPKHIPVMNLPQYATFRNQLAAAGGTASEVDFSDPSVLGPGTDWQDALYRRTLLQKHGISLSGGTDKSHFYLSGEYFNQEGIAPGSGFTRYSTRLNLDNQARNWLKIGINMSASQTQEKVNTTNAGIIQLALQQNPGVPVKNPDGSWGGPATTQFQYTNPIMIANIYNDYNKSSALIGNAYANINLVKGLVWYNEVNTSLQYYNYYSFHPGYTAGGYIVPQSSASSSRSASNNYWWGINTRLQYDTRIGRHAITAMAGHEAQLYQGESLNAGRINFLTNINQELSGGDASSISNVSNGSGKYNGAQESYFGRVNYIYNEKYILLGTLRADGSSSFGEKKRWGYFPAAALAWRISKEGFMQNIHAINDLKLRVEYGWSGNKGLTGAGIYSVLQSVPTGWGSGFLLSNFNNPFLQWETDKTTNIGFDLHMFNNRLEVIADAYIKNISKLLALIPGPFTYGGDIAYSPGYLQWASSNSAEMRNKGIGVTINSVNIDNKILTWKTGFNISVDRNKITQLPNPINPLWAGTGIQFLTQEGSTASMIMGYIPEGLFKDYNDIKNHAVQTSNGVLTISPTQGTWIGDIKFKDLNNDGIINEKDRTQIGNPWPKFTFGFNNSFSYKEFDLNVFIIGSIGNDIFNYPRYQSEIPGNSGVFGNYLESVSHFAVPSSYNIADSLTTTLTNPGFRIPRIAPGDPNGNNRVSSWFIEDGSFVRIKNVTLSYHVPNKWIARTAIKGLKASVNVQNLATFTKYKGYDPEVGMVRDGNTLIAGLDSGRYPSVRFYSFSLIADF
ncbi:MAG: TonB-dependent receptor [Bacteroidota bacterium]|nr:TonB-dependent receptor [Bacteroidota bacterium]